MLQTQEQQHIIIYGTQQMHACTARTIVGRPCFKKEVHFIIIIIVMALAQQLRGHVTKFQKMPS